jgi:cobalt/nickel transport system permease protein
MHITDGALSTPVMITTNVIAAGVVAGTLRKIDYERVPRIGVLAAVFFMVSFVRIQIGPSSVHLLLNGLLGLLLGWAALPALAVALFLQMILLGYGGLTSLGANILGMGLPALAVAFAFSERCRQSSSPREATAWGAAAGGTSVFLTALLLAFLLHVSSPEAYATAVKALVLAHIPVALIEAGVVGAASGFLKKVRPDLLSLPLRNSYSGDRT